MVEEGPYEILPYDEVEKLKKEIEDLRKKSASSGEILNSIERLTKIMESMLHLFESAAKGMEKEGEGPLGKKLNKLVEQNETIAESLLSLVDMVKELQLKEQYIVKEKPQQFVLPEPMSFEPTPRIESPEVSAPPPRFERPRPAPRQAPPMPPRAPPMEGPPPMPPRGGPVPPTRAPPMEGPMPMPTGSFKDLELPEEKPKKGLFRKLRK